MGQASDIAREEAEAREGGALRRLKGEWTPEPSRGEVPGGVRRTRAQAGSRRRVRRSRVGRAQHGGATLSRAAVPSTAAAEQPLAPESPLANFFCAAVAGSRHSLGAYHR